MVERQPDFYVRSDVLLQADVLVDGRRADPGTIAFEPIGFGKQAEPPLPVYPFVLVADAAAFRERFAPLFDYVMADLRDDDARHGYDPTVDSARPVSIADLFALPHDERMRVMTFFSWEILWMYLRGSDDRLRWVGMSVDDIALGDATLRIEGTVRRPVRPARRGPIGAVRRLFGRLRP